MIVTKGDIFISLIFQSETGDFKGNPNKIERLKAAIPEEERDYNPDKKIWLLENNEHNQAVIKELQGETDV